MQEDFSSISKTSIITGGTSGIGKAIAEKLQKEDYRVLVADKNEADTQNFDFKKCDVTSANDVANFHAWASEKVEAPDVLVLNAGQGISEKLTEGDPEKWQQVINTIVMGSLRFIRAFVPAMLKRKKGNVVIISSVSANNPHPYGGIYAASKTALEVIAETLRLETLPHINVTVVSPGIVETNFFENEISANKSISELNMGSIAAEEIAEDVFYAINKKSGTSINKIVTRPLEQPF